MSRRKDPLLAVVTATVLAALLPSVFATNCLFYTDKASCERFTDTGSCKWDPKTNTCLVGGKKLPPGAFGVAVVGLNPDTAPLELKPGPSSSFGNVSLVKGLSPSVKKAKTGESESSSASGANVGERTPAAELPAAFCTLPDDPGRCRAAIRRWRWDSEAGRCVEFVWGGCDGNANRFETSEACEAAAQAWCV